MTVAMLTDSKGAGCLLTHHSYPSNQPSIRAALSSKNDEASFSYPGLEYQILYHFKVFVCIITAAQMQMCFTFNMTTCNVNKFEEQFLHFFAVILGIKKKMRYCTDPIFTAKTQRED